MYPKPVNKSKNQPKFDFQLYKQSQNSKQYIADLIEISLHKKKIHSPFLCMNQLYNVINELQIPLKVQQIHQMYIYCTFDQQNNTTKLGHSRSNDMKQKLHSIINQQKHKVNLNALAQWLDDKIINKEIVFLTKSRQKKSQSAYVPSTKKQKSLLEKLPPLRGKYSDKLQQQLKYLIEIFEQMQRQRQSSGLIPLNQNQNDQLQIPDTNIPYDPELYTLNNTLSKLKIKAEDRLARIIELAKGDQRIRVKLEEAIEKFQKQRIQANEKVGRIGAMKAYKRLVEKKKQEVKKIRNLKLGQEENLVKATHLHALLNLPQIKSNKIIY